MASGRDNHYAALGLTKSASADEIKKAFQNLAKELHPDVNPSPAADAAFARVKDAYDILRDKDKKATYDKMLSHYVDTGYNEEDLRRRAEAFRRAHQSECGIDWRCECRLPLASGDWRARRNHMHGCEPHDHDARHRSPANTPTSACPSPIARQYSAADSNHLCNMHCPPACAPNR